MKAADPDPEEASRAEALRWIRTRARPLATLDPAASLGDLAALEEPAAEALIVGMGAGTRGAHELFTLEHRIVRLLVERLGFRAVALDIDFTTGLLLDAWVRGGEESLDEVLADEPVPIWRIEEIYGLLGWVRDWNRVHAGDPVAVLGLEMNAVRPFAFDLVLDYVRAAAPERLAELEVRYAKLRSRESISDRIHWYRALENKQSLIADARAARDLVAACPRGEGHALAERCAYTIACFYERYAGEGTNMAYVERRLAENAVWWRERTGSKIVIASASTHVSNGRRRAVSFPPQPVVPAQQNCGSYLRQQLGHRYMSVGLTFDHGSLTDYGGPDAFEVVPPAPELMESVLGAVGPELYLLPLSGVGGSALPTWLTAPALTRVIGPRYDPKIDGRHHMAGGSPAEWFDLIVHCQVVTPTHLIADAAEGAR